MPLIAALNYKDKGGRWDWKRIAREHPDWAKLLGLDTGSGTVCARLMLERFLAGKSNGHVKVPTGPPYVASCRECGRSFTKRPNGNPYASQQAADQAMRIHMANTHGIPGKWNFQRKRKYPRRQLPVLASPQAVAQAAAVETPQLIPVEHVHHCPNCGYALDVHTMAFNVAIRRQRS